MRTYSWGYGIFHWFIHYVLAWALVMVSGFSFHPSNFGDMTIMFVATSLIDLDHLTVLKKFGVKRYLFSEKRLVMPLHNFFFLSVFAMASAISAIFLSRNLAILLLAPILHIAWDVAEDVFIFRTSFRRWEKTWGLDTKDMEDAYNEILENERRLSEGEAK